MNRVSLLLISLLLTGTLCLDVEPRKPNMVSKLLKKTLDPLFEYLSNRNHSLAEIDLTEDVGRFFDVEASISGGLTHEIDGRGSWGFTLALEMKDIHLGAQYDIKHLELPRLFPIFGKGALEIAVQRISLNMVFAALYNMTAERFDITIPTFNMSAGTSKVKFESLMDNLAVTDFLNKLISDLVPDLVTTINEPLHREVTRLSDHYGNGILYCIRTQPFTLEKCIEDFIKGNSKNELPARLTDIVTDVVRKNFLEYTSPNKNN